MIRNSCFVQRMLECYSTIIAGEWQRWNKYKLFLMITFCNTNNRCITASLHLFVMCFILLSCVVLNCIVLCFMCGVAMFEMFGCVLMCFSCVWCVVFWCVALCFNVRFTFSTGRSPFQTALSNNKLYTITCFNFRVPTCSVWEENFFRETGVVHRITSGFSYFRFYVCLVYSFYSWYKWNCAVASQTTKSFFLFK
jgi:hypothetical protein